MSSTPPTAQPEDDPLAIASVEEPIIPIQPIGHPAETLEKLDYPIIQHHLAQLCATEAAQQRVMTESLCLPDRAAMRAAIDQTSETKRLLQQQGRPTIDAAPTMSASLQRLAKGGELLEVTEASHLLRYLTQGRQIARFFIPARSKTDTPALWPWLEALTLPNEALEALEQIVTPDGAFRPEASPRLGQLMDQVRMASAQLQQDLAQWIRKPHVSGAIQDPIITEREGRWVVPVKVTHKSEVPGLIHDTSSSGATVFIEPEAFVAENNRIKSLRADLHAEQTRLLRVLSQTLQPLAEPSLSFMTVVTELDLCLAKGQLSLQMRANPVELMDEPGHIHLRQARHPVLLLQHPGQTGQDHVVPNDLVLEPPNRTLIITGPNTGGKTVCLKLVGLCALMTQMGMHVPCWEGSRLSVFHPILCDLGDSQSLVQNLSTFSGHIQQLSAFTQQPDLSSSLILIDEICAGTDPEQGAVLAEALLDYYYTHQATVLTTTHLGHLKLVAYQHPGYMNASVEFDLDSLMPTYRLFLGVSGTSHALAIAQRLGLKSSIVDKAEQLQRQQATTASQVLTSLETQQMAVGKALRESERLHAAAQTKEQTLQVELDRLERSKQVALDHFKRSLKDKLSGIERELNELRRSLKHQRLGTVSEVDHLRQRFRTASAEFSETMVEEQGQLFRHKTFEWKSLLVGDSVESRDLAMVGQIIEKNEKKQTLVIQSGVIKATIPLSDVVNHRKYNDRKWQARQYQRSSGQSSSGSSTPGRYRMSVDVRGYKVEDALEIVQKTVDEAIMQQSLHLDIIHGRGTGALKRAIREYLDTLVKDKLIVRHHPAQAVDGGDGKTVVDFKLDR